MPSALPLQPLVFLLLLCLKVRFLLFSYFIPHNYIPILITRRLQVTKTLALTAKITVYFSGLKKNELQKNYEIRNHKPAQN